MHLLSQITGRTQYFGLRAHLQALPGAIDRGNRPSIHVRDAKSVARISIALEQSIVRCPGCGITYHLLKCVIERKYVNNSSNQLCPYMIARQIALNNPVLVTPHLHCGSCLPY